MRLRVYISAGKSLEERHIDWHPSTPTQVTVCTDGNFNASLVDLEIAIKIIKAAQEIIKKVSERR